MAGSYPDVPSRRMALDADGSIFLYGRSIDVMREANAAERASLNSEEHVSSAVDLSTHGPGDYETGWLFPELRELDGVFIVVDDGADANEVRDVESSGDTTNLRDGSWGTEVADYTANEADTYARYRDDITSLASSSKRGIRYLKFASTSAGHTEDLQSFMVYGEIAAGETPDRLLWVDNDTGSEFGLPIDYGDIPRGSAEEREVLLRNNSGSLTAAAVQITAGNLYLDSDSWYTFKEAAGSYQGTLPLSSSIGAGSDSPVLTIRRNTPDDETTGLHAARAFASVGSWS